MPFLAWHRTRLSESRTRRDTQIRPICVSWPAGVLVRWFCVTLRPNADGMLTDMGHDCQGAPSICLAGAAEWPVRGASPAPRLIDGTSSSYAPRVVSVLAGDPG